jgi:hypothetical protein
MIEHALLLFAIIFFTIVSVETLPKLPGGFCLSNYVCFVPGCLLGVYFVAWWMGISTQALPRSSEAPALFLGLTVASLAGGLGMVAVKHWIVTRSER